MVDYFADIWNFLRQFWLSLDDKIAKYFLVDLRSECLSSTTICVNDGYIISGIKSQFKYINTFLYQTFSVYVEMEGSLGCLPDEGRFTCLIKEQNKLLYNNITDFKNAFLNAFTVTVGSENSIGCQSGEGRFTCLIKAQNKLLYNQLLSLNSDFINLFGGVHSDAGTTVCTSNDGYFTCLIKSQNKVLMDKLDSIFFALKGFEATTSCKQGESLVCFLKAQNQLVLNLIKQFNDEFFTMFLSNYDKKGCTSGMFTCFIKNQNDTIISSVKSLENYLYAMLTVYADNESKLGCDRNEGRITCLIKGQIKLLYDNISDFKRLFLNMFTVYAHSEDSLGCLPDEGRITCLIKGQNKLLINTIKNLTPSSSKDYQSQLDLITKKLDDLIKKVGDISLTPSGTTIWDFLKELVRGVTTVLDGILDFLNNITDLIRDIVIPSDVSFITTEFNRINDKLSAKFSLVSTLSTTITTSFNVKESNLLAKDFTVTFPTYGSMTLLNVTYLNSVLPYAKRILSAVLYLLTAIYAYKKITNRMVE